MMQTIKLDEHTFEVSKVDYIDSTAVRIQGHEPTTDLYCFWMIASSIGDDNTQLTYLVRVVDQSEFDALSTGKISVLDFFEHASETSPVREVRTFGPSAWTTLLAYSNVADVPLEYLPEPGGFLP